MKYNRSTPDKEFLNLSEAAAFLGIGVATLRKYVKAGTVPEAKFPGSQRYLFSKAALRNWAESLFNDNNGEAPRA